MTFHFPVSLRFSPFLAQVFEIFLFWEWVGSTPLFLFRKGSRPFIKKYTIPFSHSKLDSKRDERAAVVTGTSRTFPFLSLLFFFSLPFLCSAIYGSAVRFVPLMHTFRPSNTGHNPLLSVDTTDNNTLFDSLSPLFQSFFTAFPVCFTSPGGLEIDENSCKLFFFFGSQGDELISSNQ